MLRFFVKVDTRILSYFFTLFSGERKSCENWSTFAKIIVETTLASNRTVYYSIFTKVVTAAGQLVRSVYSAYSPLAFPLPGPSRGAAIVLRPSPEP